MGCDWKFMALNGSTRGSDDKVADDDDDEDDDG
jgi:hypothetical protein